MQKQTCTLYAFEDEMFESRRGLSLSLREPAPDGGNPVLAAAGAGAPDDGKICYTASVAPWDDGFGLWYQAENRAGRLSRCCARSADGFEWERLGAVVGNGFHAAGNSFNVWNDGDRFLMPLTATETLKPEQIGDPRLRAIAERELASTGRAGITCYVGLAASRDGMTWTVPEPKPVIPLKLEAPRLYRFQNRHIMNSQTNGQWFDPPHPSGRVVMFFHSTDLMQWETHPACLTNTAHESIHGQTHVGVVPIKCIDDRLLIGLGGRFDDAAELDDQHWDITLLYSYNGLDWRPVVPAVERRSWIRRGRPGEWDFGGVVGMGMVEDGDRAAVYYNGTTIGNCSHSFPLYDPGPGAVGRVCFQRDRFASLQPAVGWRAAGRPEKARNAQGVLTTKPLELSATHPLALNVDIPPGTADATVDVDLVAPNGMVLCSARLPHGGISVPVPFDKPVAAGPARIRVTMNGGPAPDKVPVLYAIYY